jgi:hypothetical protein
MSAINKTTATPPIMLTGIEREAKHICIKPSGQMLQNVPQADSDTVTPTTANGMRRGVYLRNFNKFLYTLKPPNIW